MRIIYSILLTFFLVGSTYLYSNFADSVRREPVEIKVGMDSGQWKIKIDRTFDCVPDPDVGTDAMVVQLKGIDIFRKDKTIKFGDELAISPIAGIEQGFNEFFIEASLSSINDFDLDASEKAHAMRVRIYRGNQLITDQTFWSQPSDFTLVATVSFEAPVSNSKPDQHQH